MSVTKKPINYLNNRDILKQIHISKNTFCSFKQKEYNQYDIIIDMAPEGIEMSMAYAIMPEQIQQARENKAARLSYEAGEKISVDTISSEGIIFRVMTWDHIPVSPKVSRKTAIKKSAKDMFEFEEDEPDFSDLEDDTTKPEVDDMVHVKLNFPPFQHFRLDSTGKLELVGKSHWRGDIETGEFCKTHGRITEKLGKMFIMLCEKYAMKFNWRGYTYNDEMRNSAILQLAYVGLRFNEAKSQNPFAYYTQTITNSFCRVLNSEKRVQHIRDDILEANNLNPSWSRQYENSERDYHG